MDWESRFRRRIQIVKLHKTKFQAQDRFVCYWKILTENKTAVDIRQSDNFKNSGNVETEGNSSDIANYPERQRNNEREAQGLGIKGRIPQSPHHSLDYFTSAVNPLQKLPILQKSSAQTSEKESIFKMSEYLFRAPAIPGIAFDSLSAATNHEMQLLECL